MRKSFIIGLCAVAAVATFTVNIAQGYILYDNSPGAVVTLGETLTGSGIYEFSEGYTWRDENGGGHTQGKLGTWASRTKAYRGYQYDGIGNTFLMEQSNHFIEYQFVIPVDDANLEDVTIQAVMNGTTLQARVYDAVNANWYSLSSLFSGGAGFTEQSATVPAAALDGSVNGQVIVKLFLTQESSGSAHGIDSLKVTATTVVPEPATFSLLGLGTLAMLGCRRRHLQGH